MGVLTDFVVADRTEAKRVGDCLKPSKVLGGIDAKVDQVKMGTLYAILVGTDYDPGFLTGEASFLYVVSDDGPWVQLVPERMVERLARLSDAEVPRIAREWRKTEEFDPKYSRWTPDDIERFLRDIAALAQKAIGERKSLLMWTCL